LFHHPNFYPNARRSATLVAALLRYASALNPNRLDTAQDACASAMPGRPIQVPRHDGVMDFRLGDWLAHD
jgi:hypothetical protein